MANYNSNYTGQDLDKSIKLTKGSIAEEFSTSKAYAVDALVIYNGDLYKCIVAHSAGSWDSSHFERTKVTDAIASGGKVTGVKGEAETDYRIGDVNISLANLGVTANAAELNTLDGITATTTELNYVHGVSSNVQTQLNAKQATIDDLATIRSGAAAGATAVQPAAISDMATKTWVGNEGFVKTLGDLGVSATAAELNTLDGITATTQELNYTDGVTSSIQTQLDGKQATITGSEKEVLQATSTELNYVHGVTSAIQTQLDGKQATISDIGDIRTNAQTGATHAGVISGNPHNVSKADVGLGNVGNFKAVSTVANQGLSDAEQTAALNNLGVTATKAELNTLDGITATTTELNYVDGVTSSIQTQLNSKVAANNAITGATKAKITYDAKGLVTGGADLAASDIPNLDAAKITSGTLADARIPNLSLSKITDVTATAAEVNTLDGIVVTTAELNTLDDINTSTTVQAQLNALGTRIDNLPSPMVFKGTLGTGGTITSLPTASANTVGHTYKVITAGTYDGKSAKVGDLFIGRAKGTSPETYEWVLVPSGDEPSGTVTNVATGQGLSGGPITSTGTISHANIGTAGTYSKVTTDAMGHITSGTNLTLNDLSVTATAAELNTLDGITATTQELNYVDGVTSAIQTQLDGKQAAIENLSYVALDTLQPALVSGTNIKTINNQSVLGSGNLSVATSLTDLGVTATAAELNTLDGITASTAELNFTDGVTSNIQTQLNGKQATLSTQTAYSAKGSATKVPQITTNTLGQVTAINEVTITQPTVNNGTLTIQKNGTNVQTFSANQSSDVTANITIALSDVGVTATAAELNTLDGITASTQELNYTDGVTSNIQTQLDNKQAAIENLSYVALDTLQPTLVSGTNIKTINSQSILGSGDISVGGDNIFVATYEETTLAEVQSAYEDGKYIYCVVDDMQYRLISAGTNDFTFQNSMSGGGTIGESYLFLDSNGWSNESYYGYDSTSTDELLNAKQDTLISGTNIKTINSQSILGSGNLSVVTTLTDLGVTATSAELNTLDGITATTAELNYCDGVTSNIQTQLNNKQSKGFASTITGDGSTTSFTVTHNLGSRDVMVQLYDLSSYDTIMAEVVRTSTSAITVEFKDAPASAKTYRVLIAKIA